MEHNKDFPLEHAKEFLKNPCEETLRKITFNCCTWSCRKCPFWKHWCPPSGELEVDLVLSECHSMIPYYHAKTISQVVLMFSEVLAKYESMFNL